MKNILPLMVLSLALSVVSFAQTPQATPIADETLRLCIASVQARNFDAAVADCGKAIAKLPANPEGYKSRGIAHANLGINDAALADLSKAVQLAPSNPDTVGMRGELYAVMEKYDLALADFNKVLQLIPNNPVALFRRSFIYSKTGKKDLALADLKAILLVSPNEAQVKTAIAQLEASMKPFEFEGRKLSTAADFAKEADTVYFLSGAYAGLRFEQKDMDRYFTVLSNCVARFPDDFDCAKKTLDYYQSEAAKDLIPSPGGLGSYRAKFDGSTQARWIQANFIPLYTAILKKNPNDVNAYSTRAASYAAMKNYDGVIADHTRIITLEPKNYISYKERSAAYRALRKYDAALADIDKAIANTTSPLWISIFRANRINILLDAKKYDAAVAGADQMLASEPMSDTARLLRGIALRGQGKNDLAIAEFSAALRHHPNFEQAYRERAATYRLTGKTDLAASDERKADQIKTGKY